MDGDLRDTTTSVVVRDGSVQEESSTPQDLHGIVASSVAIIPISSSSPYNTAYPSATQVSDSLSPLRKRRRYEAPWKTIARVAQPLFIPPPLSSSSPSNNTLTCVQRLQNSSSLSESSKSQPSSDHCHVGNSNESSLYVRKGKHVSPVWKPHEMLWLARAWRVQYQGGESLGESTSSSTSGKQHKSRAEKDKEVAEFLNKHGIHRDAKTAGTKWDNMLGEFRKVFEWEKGPEKVEFGKSYFRMSQYERKLHRLPASFDEEVYGELSQFMGLRQRAPQHSKHSNEPAVENAKKPKANSNAFADYNGLQLMNLKINGSTNAPNSWIVKKEDEMTGGGIKLRRIGKVKMVWEETTHIWAEEGKYECGMVKVDQLNFFNADELTFLDESLTASTLEAFETGPIKGFSIDSFSCGQQIKVFGRHKAGCSKSQTNEFNSLSLPSTGLRDTTQHYMSLLKEPATSIPNLFELSSYLQKPPPKEMRFPVRQDVYEDLPRASRDSFFCQSTSDIDCRTIMYDIVGSLLKTQALTTKRYGRESYIGTWDNCINNIIASFCTDFFIIRKPSQEDQQWPNVCGFFNNLCVWRGEEAERLVEQEHDDPCVKIMQKFMWTYGNAPYILGYYAVKHAVTFCALTNTNERIDLHSLDLSDVTHRMRALVSCWRIARILPLLVESCGHKCAVFSDYQRIEKENGKMVVEVTPRCVKKYYPSRRKWDAAKEIYEFLDKKLPHAECLHNVVETELGLVFEPRGVSGKPTNMEQLLEALKHVTKGLVALHGISFMHRNITWNNVMKKISNDEWFLTDFEQAVVAPHGYPYHGYNTNHFRSFSFNVGDGVAEYAPEMCRGVHGIEVDIWSVGHLIRTCGLSSTELLRNFQSKCLEQDPQHRPSAADCYRYLVQLQSSLPGC